MPLPPLEMKVTWSLDALLGYIHTWSGLKALQASDDDGPAAIARFASELAGAWGDPARPRDVRWPLAVRAGRIA